MSEVHIPKEEELMSSLENIVLSYLLQFVALASLVELFKDNTTTNTLKLEKSYKDTSDEGETTELKLPKEGVSEFSSKLQTSSISFIEGLLKVFFGLIVLWGIYKFTEDVKKELLYRSLLIQSIALWESFVKDYLREILQYELGPLKELDKEKIFSIAEILRAEEEYPNVRSMIVEKYLDMLFFGKNIDEIKDELTRREIVDLEKFQEWSALREAYYRRNLFTHNNGRINKVYCKKVKMDPCDVGSFWLYLGVMIILR